MAPAQTELSHTLCIMEGVLNRLREYFPASAVEYFPERPGEYRLSHPQGALLLNYAASTFPKHADTHAVVQPRELTFTITVVNRELHGNAGAVAVLDTLRLCLIGYRPPACDKPLRAIKDYFIEHNAGVWYYGCDLATSTVQIQECE